MASGEPIAEHDPSYRPGKQYVPLLGVYLPLVEECTMEVKETDVC